MRRILHTSDKWHRLARVNCPVATIALCVALWPGVCRSQDQLPHASTPDVATPDVSVSNDAGPANETRWSQDQIAEVLHRLRSSSYQSRQAAVARLQEIPAAQIEGLVQAVAVDASSEVTRRVYEFLELCYISDDDHRSRIAGELLEESVDSSHWMTAELAAEILQRNGRIRVARSLLELQTLGATVHPGDPQEIWKRRYDGPVGIVGIGGALDQIRIDVGESWRGSDRGMVLFQRLSPLVEDELGLRGLRLGIYLIDGHPLGDPEISSLKATFGDRRVVSRGKVCLGITSDPLFGDNVGCRIGQVSPGSSAGDAGLEQSDIILKLNDEDVKDFEHLVELLKQFKPGDRVIMTVQRPGSFPGFPNQPFRPDQRFHPNQLMDIPVTLKGWDEMDP